MILNRLSNVIRNQVGAVLVEFGLIFFILVMFAFGVADVALSIIAKQQVNSVAAVGSFYAVKRGAVSTLSADISSAVATQVVPIPVFGLSTITVTTTTYCGCYANDQNPTLDCLSPVGLPVCEDNFGGTVTYKMTQGVYAIVEASAYYSVLFPIVWSTITPLTSDNRLPIVVKSYVRID